jgi:hypothetical protein
MNRNPFSISIENADALLSTLQEAQRATSRGSWQIMEGDLRVHSHLESHPSNCTLELMAAARWRAGSVAAHKPQLAID